MFENNKKDNCLSIDYQINNLLSDRAPEGLKLNPSKFTVIFIIFILFKLYNLFSLFYFSS